MKIYLPIYLTLYLLVTFVVPSWRVWRQTGRNPITFGQTENAHDFIGRVMKALVVLLVVAVVAYCLGGHFYQNLLPVVALESRWSFLAGLILLHVALAWIIVAQAQMAGSWRIGIDEQHPTALVTGGLFAWSRNPIFLGMLSSLLGLFLVIPNALTLLVLVVSWVVIQIQVRLEEDFLERQHGEPYRRYRAKVGRYLL